MTTTNQQTYSIEDGDGNQLTTGLTERSVRRLAQRMADERGSLVSVYSTDEDVSAWVVLPTEIDVYPSVIEYGGHLTEAIEAAIPEGFAADWSSVVVLSLNGSDRVRYRAPIVSK